MKNIHILPTDKPSRLQRFTDVDKIEFELASKDEIFNKGINIYITNDEDIKEGDWFIANNGVHKCIRVDENTSCPFITLNSKGEEIGHFKTWKTKIILTTDFRLAPDVQKIDDEFLEWFVKNPSCEEVEIKKVWFSLDKSTNGNLGITSNGYWGYKIIIPKEEPKYVSSGGAKYVFGTVKGEYTIGNPSPNTVKGEFALAMGYNPETTNKSEGHHSIVIGNGLTSTKPYQLLVDRNGVKIDKIMTIEEYELLSQVLKSINDIKI
jgi:hypothetical protein